MTGNNDRRSRLVACVVCVCAVASAAMAGEASSAMASVCATGGYASGASLQGDAQKNIWLTEAGWGKNLGVCASRPTITYSSTTQGEGLDEFGNNNGVLNEKEDETAFKSGSPYKDRQGTGAVLDWYVGVDEGPDDAQLLNAEVASGDKKDLLEEITIPIAQAPVAVLFSLPAKCTIAEGTKLHLSGKTLVQIWEGTQVKPKEGLGEIEAQGGYKAATWGALLTQLKLTIVAKEGCESKIILQAREGETGTAYAFKDYLSEATNNLHYNLEDEQFETKNLWDGYVSDAPTWPSETEELGNNKGSDLVKKTASTPGSVGFANTADSTSVANGGFTSKTEVSTYGSSVEHQIVFAELENNEGKVSEEAAKKGTPVTPEFANPVSGKPATHAEFEKNAGSCQSTSPINTDVKTPYSYTDSWDGITASDPNIGVDVADPEAYPGCALTYDLVWHHYSAENLFEEAQAEEITESVKSLFKYVTGPTGQAEASRDDYDPILSTPTWKSHIAEAVENL
jgi:hypothetical protein